MSCISRSGRVPVGPLPLRGAKPAAPLNRPMPAMSAPFHVETHAHDLFVLVASRGRGPSHPVACLDPGMGPCRVMAETGPLRRTPARVNRTKAMRPIRDKWLGSGRMRHQFMAQSQPPYGRWIRPVLGPSSTVPARCASAIVIGSRASMAKGANPGSPPMSIACTRQHRTARNQGRGEWRTVPSSNGIRHGRRMRPGFKFEKFRLALRSQGMSRTVSNLKSLPTWVRVRRDRSMERWFQI